MNMRDVIGDAQAKLVKAITAPVQPIGIDIDGTIDENPQFFGMLSRIWPAAVYIITFRRNPNETQRYLEELGITYTELILVNTFEQKAVEIKKRGIGIFFDDMDEVIAEIPENVTVLKVRNGGNFEDKKWLYSKKTGTNID